MDLFHAWFNGSTSPWSCADEFLVCNMIMKTYIFLRFRILADISVLLILAVIFWVCSLALRKLSGELFFFFHFFNKIQDGR